jgi:hypothetical protein
MWEVPSMAGPEGTETAVVTFEECSNKMEATEVEAALRAAEVAVERQELRVGSRQQLHAARKRLITPRRPCSTKGSQQEEPLEERSLRRTTEELGM